MPTANPEAIKLNLRFEGFRPKPYLCSAGVPTIGIGSTRYADGTRVTLADPPITRERAVALLELEQLRVDVKIRAKFGNIGVDRSGALGSFAYNLGFGALAGSTLAKLVLKGDHKGALAQFGRWDHAGGRKVRGLTLRRDAEQGVYARGR